MSDGLMDKDGFMGLKIIVAGGATGGHLFPGIAIAEEIKSERPESRVLFVSTGTAIEQRVLPRTGFDYHWIAAEGIKGRGLAAKIRAIMKLATGVYAAVGLIRQFRPDLIIGVGSYSSAPAVIGGWLLGVPVALHEQNALPGITNRLLSRLADRVFVSFQKTTDRFPSKKVRVTGNPVRREILQAMASSGDKRAAEAVGFTVLIVGGSQGARRINEAVTGALVYLKDRRDLFFIHQTGTSEEPAVRAAYQQAGVACRVQSFFDDMAACYDRADLLICRSGATTVAEILCLGKPAILVPFPFAADDHQTENARALAEAGGAELLPEGQLSAPGLAEKISYYAVHRARLAEMGQRLKALARPEAGRRIAAECLTLLAESKKRRAYGQACI
jgi:UDP-N-acetylglucosamine--N-acetylmuramyl-(pentapeptide) pyrophosphoryl-undecaprenol N-acetylglucosamine transferase